MRQAIGCFFRYVNRIVIFAGNTSIADTSLRAPDSYPGEATGLLCENCKEALVPLSLRRARECHGPQGAAAKTFPQHTYCLLSTFAGEGVVLFNPYWVDRQGW